MHINHFLQKNSASGRGSLKQKSVDNERMDWCSQHRSIQH